MRTITKLFGSSPIAPLQAHMSNVSECIEKMKEIFEKLEQGDHKGIDILASEISELEHAADLTKNDIRNNLPRGFFLPIDRGNLLDILALQDSIADKTEDVGVLLRLRKLTMIEEFKSDFKDLLKKNMEAFEIARKIINELDELLEYSFGGNQAEKVNEMVNEVAYKEHEADILQQILLKKLFNLDEKLVYAEFILWKQIMQEVCSISNIAEKLGNRIRTMLELK